VTIASARRREPRRKRKITEPIQEKRRDLQALQARRDQKKFTDALVAETKPAATREATEAMKERKALRNEMPGGKIKRVASVDGTEGFTSRLGKNQAVGSS